MVTDLFDSMHKDHLEWSSEHEAWMSDIETWRNEQVRARADLVHAMEMIEADERMLLEHLVRVKAQQQLASDHERRMADKAKSGQPLEEEIVAGHSEESESEENLRVEHELLKRLHQEMIAWVSNVEEWAAARNAPPESADQGFEDDE